MLFSAPRSFCCSYDTGHQLMSTAFSPMPGPDATPPTALTLPSGQPHFPLYSFPSRDGHKLLAGWFDAVRFPAKQLICSPAPKHQTTDQMFGQEMD